MPCDADRGIPQSQCCGRTEGRHARQAIGERDHILREPLYAETKEEQEKLFNSGGAGGYAQPSQYVQVLAALLNDGKSPKNGAEILKPETVKLMWENQIPEHPDFAREGLTPAKAEMSNAAPEIYPQEGKLTDQLL